HPPGGRAGWLIPYRGRKASAAHRGNECDVAQSTGPGRVHVRCTVNGITAGPALPKSERSQIVEGIAGDVRGEAVLDLAIAVAAR
ncbi:MAG: hypothetical protein ABI679_15645, partial [Gemmatimonadota bacterium]